MRGKPGDEVRLRHIYDAILEIELYVAGKSFSGFMDSSMMRFACIKQLEIVGEASNHISAETKNIFSSVEWAQIVGMRTIFVHEYFGIDANLVWEILTNDIPELKDRVTAILDRYSIG